MKTVAEINNQTRALLNRFRDGAFARAAHHKQCMDALKMYMRALTEATNAATEAAWLTNEPMKTRRLVAMQRRIDDIFLIEDEEVEL